MLLLSKWDQLDADTSAQSQMVRVTRTRSLGILLSWSFCNTLHETQPLHSDLVLKVFDPMQARKKIFSVARVWSMSWK